MTEVKYIAFLDILGFKDLIEKNQLPVIEKLYDTLQKSLLYSFAYTNPNHRSKKEIKSLPPIEENNLNSLVISDSIIIWTDNDTQGDFLELIMAVKYFMYIAMIQGFPLRGAISSGELVVKNGRYERSPKFNSYTTLIGLSLTRAYILESKSDWAGCLIDDICISHFNKVLLEKETDTADIAFFEEMDIIRNYEVPLKSGPVKKYYTINWTHFHGPRLTVKKVKDAFKSYNKNIEDWSVKNKLENTLKYLRDTKKGYKAMSIKLSEKKSIT